MTLTLADMIVPRPASCTERFDVACNVEKLNWIIGEGDTDYTIAVKWINDTFEKLDLPPRMYRPLKKNFSARRKILLTVAGHLEHDEYHMTVTNESVTIEGGSRTAVLYGVRSFCQVLAVCSLHGGLCREIPVGLICDKPRFAYRGVLLDTGRHFHKKEVIKELLDQMSLYKMNRFHWHINDRQGWRLSLKCYPELVTALPKNRSYSQGFYTREDVIEIRDYAENLGIEVVPEIEMPGHSGTVFMTHPELACPSCKNPFGEDVWEYCLGNPDVKKFLTKILKEVKELFPHAPLLHIGGDEATASRWEPCPVCQKKMKALKLKKVRELEAVFMEEMNQEVKKLGFRAATWSKHEGSYEKFSKNMILQNWLTEDVSTLLSTGLDIINSYGNATYVPWYNNELTSDWSKKAYEYDMAKNVPEKSMKQILGGEYCIWTEELPQWRTLRRSIPGLRVLAENLWTAADQKNFEDFRRRENELCESGLFRFN